MKQPFSLVLASAAALVVSACAPEAPEIGSDSLAGTRLNGPRLNGPRLNGTRLFVTAAYPNPGRYGGRDLGGTTLWDEKVEGVSLHATELSGRYRGALIRGTDFVGAVLPGLDSEGGPVKLYIEDIKTDALGLYAYDIVAVSDAGKAKLCDGGVAVPIRGIWDHHEGNPGNGGKIPGSESVGITFGCRDMGATAKCVDMGYWPWLGTQHDLAHQACVRMVRADYCGDGRSWTEDGTVIDVEDDIVEQRFGLYDPRDGGEEWVLEATWGPDGATCVERFRYEDRHPRLETSLHDEVKMGRCPNLPQRLDDYDARKMLRAYPPGARAGRSFCGWELPPTCDPSVQVCIGEPNVDFFDFSTVNAKRAGTW